MLNKSYETKVIIILFALLIIGFFYVNSSNKFCQMEKTSKGLVAVWKGVGQIMEIAGDENRNGIYEVWTSIAWENKPPSITTTMYDKNEDGKFESSSYSIAKLPSEISDVSLSIFDYNKNIQEESTPNALMLYMQENNGKIKVIYQDLNFDGEWDFMEKKEKNSEERQRYLWWQDRWQAVTEADGSKPDHIGQWILIDGKKVPMKWENGAWNEAQ